MPRFTTYDEYMSPMTIGVVAEYRDEEGIEPIAHRHQDSLSCWSTAAAWGKLATFSRLDARDLSAEAAVYQDGCIGALQPCGNACLAVAGRLLGTRPGRDIVIAEPRSGYRYLCRATQAGNGLIRVEGEVEYPVGSAQDVGEEGGVTSIVLDNYVVRLRTGAGSSCFPNESLSGTEKAAHIDLPSGTVAFLNSHGAHGASPLTGLIILTRLFELGLVSASALVAAQISPGDVRRTSPGRRALRLPIRLARYGGEPE